MECMAANEGRSQQVRDPTRCLFFSDPSSPRYTHAPLRAVTVQDMFGRSQPFLARRLHCQDLDLPVLLSEKSFPSSLRHDLRDKPSRRVISAIHYGSVLSPADFQPQFLRFLAAIAPPIAGIRLRARYLHD